jgi:hypothetical protein
MIVD